MDGRHEAGHDEEKITHGKYLCFLHKRGLGEGYHAVLSDRTPNAAWAAARRAMGTR